MGFLAKMTFWKKNKTPTTLDARASTKDPQISEATIVSVEPTKVDACVSTEDQPTRDGSTMTMIMHCLKSKAQK